MNFQGVVEVNHDSHQFLSLFQGFWALASAGRWLFLLDLAQLLFLPDQGGPLGLASGSPVSRVAPAAGAASAPISRVAPAAGAASAPLLA